MGTKNQDALELWGGIECTLNRVGDRYFNQLDQSGHTKRIEDVERFAELGIRTLRYPLLWEHLAPESLDQIDWTWADERMERLRALAIRPIVGFLHHGSGPRYTNLLDEDFPRKLANFAGAVAKRYPWLDAFTPINEPLTTARFSGLYGHWYPHGRDGLTFARALLNQVRATVLAMKAIRDVNPRAQLIQTDDLGKTFASPHLQYQADFENERRWLSWDLLCGRVDSHHSMWSYLRWVGIEERSLALFREEACPPDVIGVNYYVTSERFLDENRSAHPPESLGGNGRDRYVDVAAARIRPEGLFGPGQILREAGERYDVPVAVTEAHLGCTREEQLRWFMETWRAAKVLRGEGLDLRAVTAWSLLGTFGWDNLVTNDSGAYEPGAFDVRGDQPRQTALAAMLRALAAQGDFRHPVLSVPGWWHRSSPVTSSAPSRRRSIEIVRASSDKDLILEETRPLLITGGAGRLAQGFASAVRVRGIAARVLSPLDLDVADEQSVIAAFRKFHPWAVVDCAGFSPADEEAEKAIRKVQKNVTAVNILDKQCTAHDIQLVTFLSDAIFGPKGSACPEEEEALDVEKHTLKVRSGEIFGPADTDDFLGVALEMIARGNHVQMAEDRTYAASFLPDFVSATLDLLIDAETGVWNLSSGDPTTPAALVRAAATLVGLDPGLVKGVPAWSLDARAPRPQFRAPTKSRGEILPPLQNALCRYARDWIFARRADARVAFGS